MFCTKENSSCGGRTDLNVALTSRTISSSTGLTSTPEIPGPCTEMTAIELEKYKDWRGFVIRGGLSPGSAYQFRVTSCNSQIGCSPHSSPPYGKCRGCSPHSSPCYGKCRGCSPHSSPPYVYYNMASAAPIYAPENLGGGGGGEGLLQIKWDPLPRSKWGSQSVSYIMYYRRQSEDEKNAQWEVVKTENTFYNKIVGLANYYLPYTVKVQAINPQGQGPNSTEVIVMSAERLPEIQPLFEDAEALNATSGVVYWTPIPNTRESARGAIGGYQINYWQEGPQCKGGGDLEAGATSVNIHGDVSEGIVVGLDPGSANCLNLQYYNAAEPSLYPEYVTVLSQGEESVRLFWKGVSSLPGEEAITGYSAWYWEVTENIRAAQVADFGLTQTGVIHGIEKDRIYRLRMLALSIGGNGTKSGDVFFTLGKSAATVPRVETCSLR
ncbi:contactin [Elysia marginata]|uniref:Contactin n=1 Tax=Elysia marginata TaxID=1093978 RepID=A0AAV4HRX6_9GAST|nr:contactin [Elysia marginata]